MWIVHTHFTQIIIFYIGIELFTELERYRNNVYKVVCATPLDIDGLRYQRSLSISICNNTDQYIYSAVHRCLHRNQRYFLINRYLLHHKMVSLICERMQQCIDHQQPKKLVMVNLHILRCNSRVPMEHIQRMRQKLW